jgi:hypothetical protein
MEKDAILALIVKRLPPPCMNIVKFQVHSI